MNRLALYVRAALWWLLPLAALAAIVGWETDWGRALSRRPLPPEPIVPQPAAVALLPEYAIAGGTAARTETVERTLFNPTRRPAPSAAQATTAQMKRGQFALTGTTVVEGKSTAFLREVAGNKSRRVRAGETINGMLVADVKPDRVKLTLGEESEELVLKVATNPRPTVQPVAAAAPPAPPAPGAPPGAATAAAPAAPAQAQDAATLAERRRAARAAAAAGAAGTTATPPAAGAPPSAPAASSAAPNPAWDAINQRYRERAATQGGGAVK
jgi:hypothetical protein